MYFCNLNFIYLIKQTNIPNTKHIMIIIQLKEGENIERALKKFKRKFEKTGVIKEIRARQAYKKPSVRNREIRKKAIYIEQIKRNSEEL